MGKEIKPGAREVSWVAVARLGLTLPSPARHGGCKKDRNRRAACPLPGQGEGSGIGQGEGEREVQTAKRELCKGLLDRERDHRKEAEGRIIQWRKWRTPVKTIARPCWSAAAITSSSRAEPPGCAIAVAPASAASGGPSGNGKKASEASTEPLRETPRRAAFSRAA